jgi:hypothetical protein
MVHQQGIQGAKRHRFRRMLQQDLGLGDEAISL